MKKLLLVVAGLAGIVAIVGGFTGTRPLIAAGATALLMSLLLLPWLDDDDRAIRRRTERGR